VRNPIASFSRLSCRKRATAVTVGSGFVDPSGSRPPTEAERQKSFALNDGSQPSIRSMTTHCARVREFLTRICAETARRMEVAQDCACEPQRSIPRAPNQVAMQHIWPCGRSAPDSRGSGCAGRSQSLYDLIFLAPASEIQVHTSSFDLQAKAYAEELIRTGDPSRAEERLRRCAIWKAVFAVSKSRNPAPCTGVERISGAQQACGRSSAT